VYAARLLCDQVVSGSYDKSILLWYERRALLLALALARSRCGALRCSDSHSDSDKRRHTGRVCLSVCRATSCRDLRRDAKPVRSFEIHSGAVFSLAIDPERIVSGSADRSIKILKFSSAV
jgi:WD40 repeat protein